MYSDLLSDVRLYVLLQSFDEDLAAAQRAAGCPCGGVLHSARYWRKPRGAPPGLDPRFAQRCSFCCAVDGCRARSTPASLRFLGRKVYLAPVVVLISAMCCGATAARVRELHELVGVSRRTLRRWRTWWVGVFARSTWWRAAAARFMPAPAVANLPLSLLERFAGELRDRLLGLLRFIAAITAGEAAAVHAF